VWESSTLFLPVRQKLRTQFYVSRCAKKTPPKSDRRKSQITKFAFVIHKHKLDLGMLHSLLNEIVTKHLINFNVTFFVDIMRNRTISFDILKPIVREHTSYSLAVHA